MIRATPQEPAMDDLLEAMDGEADLLRRRLVQLGRLCEALVRPGHAGLEEVLAEMELAHRQQAEVDQRLARARGRLADALGLSQRRLTLTALAERVGQPRGAFLRERRREMVQLTQKVRQENWRASVLLAESARINRLILERLWPQGQAVTTYSASGADSWRPESGLFEAQL